MKSRGTDTCARIESHKEAYHMTLSARVYGMGLEYMSTYDSEPLLRHLLTRQAECSLIDILKHSKHIYVSINASQRFVRHDGSVLASISETPANVVV
jgi:hypothetical protein